MLLMTTQTHAGSGRNSAGSEGRLMAGLSSGNATGAHGDVARARTGGM